MLIDFFYTLRAAKLPVSVKEFLTLLEALQADVVGPTNPDACTMDDFYFLSRTALVKDATPVGAVECNGCHEKVQGHARIADHHGDCESCHGNGSLHSESQEPEDIRCPDAADCLACH
ncbi:MAG: hypothetical protein IH617_22260, partial [Hydrogenophaga sp.]|nr:hypothetical protein [Hydrogenophaga sp.]